MRDRFRKVVMPIFNSVIDTETEKWDVATKMVGGRGPQTNGGPLYCLSYNGKPVSMHVVRAENGPT